MSGDALPGRAGGQSWIFADIGGTWVRFVRWQAGTGFGPVTRWRANAFASPGAALETFRRSLRAPAARAAIAIATPLGGTRIRMTNRHWSFDVRDLQEESRLDALLLVNDFVAAAAGLPALATDDVGVIRAAPACAGRWLLVGPGTGLGAAALLDAGGAREQVLASEAGHMSFAASDAALDDLRALAIARWSRVSWERVLGGDGLSLLHFWQRRRATGFAHVSYDRAADGIAGGHGDGHCERGPIGEAASLLPPAAVSALIAARDPVAMQTAHWFSHLLGAFAGDLCLALGIDGGLWLTGGVLDGIGEGFDVAAFLSAFDDKGRYRERQRAVPIRRVQVADLAFRGLARLVVGASSAPAVFVSSGIVRNVDERSAWIAASTA